ncbi:MAG: SulP family inorganic anion transporter [Sulfurimonas sp.]|jgi:SulP family sulfate permease|nr:SulP family inorganic anion transporter [Sulfurimonas sp.]
MFQDTFKEIKSDLPASIIVFFVALPLCLGIALASGAPLFSGVIAGIIGGIIVGAASGSRLGVSGPAAGLAVIVFGGIATLGSWEAFLAALVIAGLLQIAMGYMKAGFIAYFFPTSVITGLLTGIGILIILKQIPHAFGYDASFLGDEAFLQAGGENTFSAIANAWEALTLGAIIISIISIAILIVWDKVLTKKYRFFEILQGPIVVVLVGILLNYLYQSTSIGLSLQADQIVSLPVFSNFSELMQQVAFPDFSVLNNIEVYKIAFVLAVVASLETLLSVEAADKLDPHKRVTPTNRELKAQGLGNFISGLVGGLPITQVIVRSSANISFGAKTKLSTILHGIFLLVSVATIAPMLNMIPLASLSAILFAVGYKLAKPTLFKKMYALGWEQFIPFMTTIVVMLFTDLLTGVLIGLVVSIFFTLHHSYRNSYHLKDVVTKEGNKDVHHIVLAQEVSFFNKASIIKTLNAIPQNAKVIIDCSDSKSIAYDVIEFIQDYQLMAELKNIEVETINFKPSRTLS